MVDPGAIHWTQWVLLLSKKRKSIPSSRGKTYLYMCSYSEKLPDLFCRNETYPAGTSFRWVFDQWCGKTTTQKWAVETGQAGDGVWHSNLNNCSADEFYVCFSCLFSLTSEKRKLAAEPKTSVHNCLWTRSFHRWCTEEWNHNFTVCELEVFTPNCKR